MKTSQIGLYVENAEVPSYKSEGASGFDIKVLFNPDVAYLCRASIHEIVCNRGEYIIKSLYDDRYRNIHNYEEYVIDYDTFKKSLISALNKKITLDNIEYDLESAITKLGYNTVNLLLPYSVVKFKTNVYTEIPEEDELQIRPRSGISSTTLLNIVFGTVDNDWRGNSTIIVQNPTPYTYPILHGTRLAQGVIVEKKRAIFNIKSYKEELSKTERGEKGLGSSGQF